MVQSPSRHDLATKLVLLSALVACGLDERDPGFTPDASTLDTIGALTPQPPAASDAGGQRGSGEPGYERGYEPGYEAGLDTGGDGLLSDAGPGADVLGAACVPGDAACVSATERIECDASGSWTSPSACANACLDGACGGECRPGSSRCASGTSAQLCDDAGRWGASVACQNACVGSACAGECVPGSSRCFDTRDSQTCNAEGQWLTPERCANACTGGACGGECVPGSQRCNAASGAPQVCNDEGLWENRSACDFVCVDGACAGECSPGSRRCNPQSGVPQLCSATGAWQNQAACPFTCSGAGECTGECRAPAARCVGARLEVCQNFQFQLAETCSSADRCDAAAGVCVEDNCTDDSDPNSTLQSHPVYGCGQRWSLPNDPSGDWIEFSSGLHVDLETGTGWMAPGGSLTRDELAAACSTLTVNGVGGWSVPTIDQTRELAAGCATTAPGGSCALSDPSCLSQSCGACSSCLGGSGPAVGLYCRPNVRICFGLRTRSACSDCGEASDWSYGVSNGNFLPRTAVTRFASFCVRPGFPL